MRINKPVSSLHLITQPDVSVAELSDQVAEACAAGVNWVQLRMKNVPPATVYQTAMDLREICQMHNARLIINDFPEVAKKADVDGVHLGKEDMDPAEARALLGHDKIIGGTANTMNDVWRLIDKEVDYIGLGPFRYTVTKDKLSPVLGAKGYRVIMQQLEAEHINIPVIAIGGIRPEDIKELKATGIHGVAVASAINKQTDINGAVHSFLKQLDHVTDSR